MEFLSGMSSSTRYSRYYIQLCTPKTGFMIIHDSQQNKRNSFFFAERRVDHWALQEDSLKSSHQLAMQLAKKAELGVTVHAAESGPGRVWSWYHLVARVILTEGPGFGWRCMQRITHTYIYEWFIMIYCKYARLFKTCYLNMIWVSLRFYFVTWCNDLPSTCRLTFKTSTWCNSQPVIWHDMTK